MANLDGTLIDLQAAFAELDTFAQTHGISVGIADYGGIRTEADTVQILGYRDDDFAAEFPGRPATPDTLQAFRPIAPFGRSYHNYGAAFDVAIIARPSGMSTAEALKLLGSYAPTVGLRWGGHFSNPDTPHFELAIPLAEAQARYNDATGGGDTPSTGGGAATVNLVVIGVLVAGAVVWAVRRKFA